MTARSYWQLDDQSRPDGESAPARKAPGKGDVVVRQRLVRVSESSMRSTAGPSRGIARIIRIIAFLVTAWGVGASGFLNLLAAADLYNRYVGDIGHLLQMPMSKLAEIYTETWGPEDAGTFDNVRSSSAFLIGVALWAGFAAISFRALRAARRHLFLPLVFIVAVPAVYAWWAQARPTGYESGFQPEQVIPLLLACMLPFAARMIWARIRRV